MIFALLLEKILVGAEIVLVEKDEKRASFVSKTFELKVEEPKGENDLAVECSGTVEGFRTCLDHLRSVGDFTRLRRCSEREDGRGVTFFDLQKGTQDDGGSLGVRACLETGKKTLLKRVFFNFEDQ